jgi:hypothetical protein
MQRPRVRGWMGAQTVVASWHSGQEHVAHSSCCWVLQQQPYLADICGALPQGYQFSRLHCNCLVRTAALLIEFILHYYGMPCPSFPFLAVYSFLIQLCTATALVNLNLLLRICSLGCVQTWLSRLASPSWRLQGGQPPCPTPLPYPA